MSRIQYISDNARAEIRMMLDDFIDWMDDELFDVLLEECFQVWEVDDYLDYICRELYDLKIWDLPFHIVQNLDWRGAVDTFAGQVNAESDNEIVVLSHGLVAVGYAGEDTWADAAVELGFPEPEDDDDDDEDEDEWE